jgi:transposase-like protein
MKKHTIHHAVLNSEKELNQYLLDSFGNNLKQAIKMHAAGISQRKVDRLGKLLFGKAVAPATTKHVFEDLLLQEAFQITKIPLRDLSLDYLYFDGLWETVKGAFTGEAKQPVVLAVSGYSVERDEHRFLGFMLASGEDEGSWKKMILQLQSRGLDFSNVKLVVDENTNS